MNIKTKIMLLAAFACPITAFGAVDLSILEESKDGSGGSFLVQASPDSPATVGAYSVNLLFSDYSGIAAPIDITVSELVGAPFAISPLGSTVDALGKQSVAENTTVKVVAFAAGDALFGPSSGTNLFRVAYEIPAFIDTDSFNVAIVPGVSPVQTIVGTAAISLPASPTTISGPTAVPEPSSFVLIGLVGLGLGLKRYYSQKSAVEAA